jgi:hypothetical protein
MNLQSKLRINCEELQVYFLELLYFIDLTSQTSFLTLKSCHLGEEWLTRKQKKLKSFRSNPETRIMDLCVVPLRDIIVNCLDHLYVLGSACSDGYVR